jgi:type IV secretion system protein VirB6
MRWLVEQVQEVVPSTPGGLLAILTQQVQTWAETVVTALAAYLGGGALAAVIVLFFVVYGYALWFGWAEAKLGEVTGKFVVAIIVIVLSTSVGLYFPMLYEFFVDGPEQIAAVALLAVGENSLPVPALDQIWTQAFNVITQIYTQAGWDISAHVLAIIMMIVTVLFVLVVFGLVLVSKVLVAVLLGITPIIILALPFQTTRSIFERWLGALVTYSITIVLAYLVASLFVQVTLDSLTYVQPGSWDLQAILPYVMSCIIAFFVLLQVPSVASNIGGGIGPSGGTAVAALAAGVATWASRQGSRIARSTYDRVGGPTPLKNRDELIAQRRSFRARQQVADEARSSRSSAGKDTRPER